MPLLLIQLSVSAPVKTTEDGSNAWAPGTGVEGQDEAPGSWLQLGSASFEEQASRQRID